MKIITATNVNNAIAQAIPYLLKEGVQEESRNGPVLVAPEPVVTAYLNPRQRVLFSPKRNANPFFHLMESLWMLAGRNDIEFPERFNSKFGQFSDDGKTFNGAYGYRWRHQFGYDQLERIIEALVDNPNDRRQVLQMWDGGKDLGSSSKDVPCNTNCYFRVNRGSLDMTVCNRSNDIIWGAYGANAVHFSFLQEYMADCIGVKVGVYYQISNNFHAYTEIYNRRELQIIAEEAGRTNLYETNPTMKIVPLMNGDHDTFDLKLKEFLNTGRATTAQDFFGKIAEPMYMAWMERKEGRPENVMSHLDRMPVCDWRAAATQWMIRKTSKGESNGKT